MINNALVRRVNCFVNMDSHFYKRHPLMFYERYKVFYRCVDCGTGYEISKLVYQQGRFMFQVVGSKEWHELSSHCVIIDSRGEVLLHHEE